jgi:hypothetical protein
MLVKGARGCGTSALPQAIVTTQGPLRLPWPTMIGWAQADAAKAV